MAENSPVPPPSLGDLINQDVCHLLKGQPVPLNTIDLKRKEALQFIPKTKVTVGYIVMTVILKDNQILMVQEAKKECCGYWYLPAGRMEPNESIIHGAKREVKEEAGVECEITTLLSLHFGGTRWIRLSFAGNVTGGCLKTLEQCDEESLQAAFYDIDDILNSKINLRSCDIIPAIQQAIAYRESLQSVPLHPPLLPNMVIHSLMLHRILLVGDLGDEGIFALSCINTVRDDQPHLLSCALAPQDMSLHITLQQALREALVGDPKVSMLGVLSVEHFGKNAHDGICITTLVRLNIAPGKNLPVVRDKNYRWVPILQKCAERLRYRLEGHVVKLIDRQ